MGDLDEYEAFQFDLAMAVKGMLKDRENTNDDTYTLLQGMRGIMQSNGGKPSKIPRPAPLVKTPELMQLPTLNQIMQMFGGAGVQVQNIEDNHG